MDQPRERILFLYLATGGGHVSAARALSREIASIAPDAVTLLFNPLNGGPEIQKTVIEDGYTLVSTRVPWIWPILYTVSSYGPVMGFQTDTMKITCTDPIARIVKEQAINRIVILHFLLIRPVENALKRLGKRDIPVMTIVTDPFTVHNLWAYRQRGQIIVFSNEAARRMARRLEIYDGLRRNGSEGQGTVYGPERILVMPPILDSRFGDPLSADRCMEIRTAHGFSGDKPLILLAGGGEGLPAGEAYLKKLLAAGLDIQVAMVCGKNKAQFRKALEIAARFPHAKVKIFGFVHIMYELMNASDIIATKGGPATVFEVISLKKPLIVTRFLYGQEQGNLDFVRNKGLGWYEPTPAGMVHRIRDLLEHPENFNQVRGRLLSTRVGIGTRRIAELLLAGGTPQSERSGNTNNGEGTT